MPKYRILEKSFIDNRLVQPGDEIESDETPAAHWEPLDKAAKTASKSAAAEDAERAEAARIEAEKRAARDAENGMPAAPPSELALIQAETKAAEEKAAEAKAKPEAEGAQGSDPLV